MQEYYRTDLGVLYCGSALQILKNLPARSVDCVMTSPPYWGLRDYGSESQIWDGDEDCEHKWKEGKVAGDIRFRPGHNSQVGNDKNPEIYKDNRKSDF